MSVTESQGEMKADIAQDRRNWNATSVVEALGQQIHDQCQIWALKHMNEDDFISMQDANLDFSNNWREKEIVKPLTGPLGGHKGIEILRNSKKSEFYGHYEKKLFHLMEEFVNLISVVDKLKESNK